MLLQMNDKLLEGVAYIIPQISNDWIIRVTNEKLELICINAKEAGEK